PARVPSPERGRQVPRHQHENEDPAGIDGELDPKQAAEADPTALSIHTDLDERGSCQQHSPTPAVCAQRTNTGTRNGNVERGIPHSAFPFCIPYSSFSGLSSKSVSCRSSRFGLLGFLAAGLGLARTGGSSRWPLAIWAV